MANYQTRLPLSTLTSASVNLNGAEGITTLNLEFEGNQETHISMPGDETEYLSIIANALLEYNERMRLCHS